MRPSVCKGIICQFSKHHRLGAELLRQLLTFEGLRLALRVKMDSIRLRPSFLAPSPSGYIEILNPPASRSSDLFKNAALLFYHFAFFLISAARRRRTSS